jgi:hypothetical protein
VSRYTDIGQHVPADAGFLCDTNVMLREKIKGHTVYHSVRAKKNKTLETIRLPLKPHKMKAYFGLSAACFLWKIVTTNFSKFPSSS